MRRFGPTFVMVLAWVVVATGSLGFAGGTASAAPSSDPTVTIQSTGCGGALFCYSPANITVPDGGTVTWTNTTGVAHTVTRCTSAVCSGTGGGSGTDAGFTNGAIGASSGATFSHTFHGAGSYNYYCSIHGFGVMHGTVTVVVATPATTATTAAAPPVNAGGAPVATQSTTPTTAATAASASSSTNLPRTGSDTQLLLVVAIVALG